MCFHWEPLGEGGSDHRAEEELWCRQLEKMLILCTDTEACSEGGMRMERIGDVNKTLGSTLAREIVQLSGSRACPASTEL